MRFGDPPPGLSEVVRQHLATDALTLTVEETAKILGLSRDAVYDGVHRGEIRAVRVGRQLRIARLPLLESLGVTVIPERQP